MYGKIGHIGLDANRSQFRFQAHRMPKPKYSLYPQAFDHTYRYADVSGGDIVPSSFSFAPDEFGVVNTDSLNIGAVTCAVSVPLASAVTTGCEPPDTS